MLTGEGSANGHIGRNARRRSGGPLDRLLHALNHPIRRQILRALARDKGSATTLARELREPLGTVSYHLNQVLADECGVVEVVEQVPRRGAVEKFYSLKKGALMDLVAVVEAIDTAAPRSHDLGDLGWLFAQLDAEGWQQVDRARAEFQARVQQIMEASRSRGGEQSGRAALVGAVAIPASAPSSSSASD